MENTRDLSKFGFREKKEAAKLLEEYCKNPEILGEGVTIEFNPNSRNIFLIDENYEVAMMNDDQLEKWFICPYCGYEGFKKDIHHEAVDMECTEYLQNIGVLEE